MPIIDTHQHFWRFNTDEYGWIPDDWSALRRDFLPEDLAIETRKAGVAGVVAVQARQSLEETRWLLELATSNPALIRGVVGWVPLVAPDVGEVLDTLSQGSRLVGLRHVLQGEPDDAHMLRPDFNRGIRALTERGLVYDILIFERHLANTLRFVDAHPGQIFVVDHVAKPKIGERILEPWAHHLRELARRPNVSCKVSGMVTEADVRAWTPAQLKAYFDVVLEAFGPSRVLFGSDWPVCLAGVSYTGWLELVKSWIAPLSAGEQAAILGFNALRTYKLA